MTDITAPAPVPVDEQSTAAPDEAPQVGDGRRLGSNVAVLAGGQMVTWTMSLVWTLVIPRALGPDSMGLVVTAWAVTGVLGVILGLGTKNFLVREMVAHPERASSLLGTALVLRFVLVVPFFAGAALYARFVDLGQQGTIILFLASGAMALTLFAEPLQAGFQAIEHMEYIAYNNVFDRAVQSIFGVALVAVGFRAIGLSVWWVLVEAALFGLNLLWMRRFMTVVLRTSLARIRQLFRDSVAYWTFGLFFMVYLWIDSAMLAALAPHDVVGWYGVPTKLFNTMMFLPTILATAWLPRLVATHERTPEKLASAARTPMEVMLVLSLPIATSVAVTAAAVIPFLYGSDYQNAVPVLVVLAFCVPPMYANNMVAQVLVAANRQFAWTKVMALATVVNPLLNLLLIHVTQERYGNGAIGAAVSLLLTELVITVIGTVMVGRGVLDLGSVRRIARSLAVCAGIAGGVFLVRGHGVLVQVPVGGVAFIGLAFAVRLLPPDEWNEVRSVGARAFGKLRSLAHRRG